MPDETDNRVSLNTSELLMKLVEQTSEIRQAVRGLERSVADLRANANTQLASLQERAGRTDTVLEVHESRLRTIEKDADETCADVETIRKEVGDLKLRLYVLIAFLSAGGGLVGGLLGKLLGM